MFYPQLSATAQEPADDLALADHGDVLGGDRLDDGRELALDADTDQLGIDGLGPDADRQGGRHLAGAGPDQDAAEDLHAWETGSEARAGVGKWIEFYNRKRPHTALGGKPPAVVYWLRNDKTQPPNGDASITCRATDQQKQRVA